MWQSNWGLVVASFVHAGSMPCSLWGPSRGDDSGRAQGAPRTAAVPGMEQVAKLSCPPTGGREQRCADQNSPGGRGKQTTTSLEVATCSSLRSATVPGHSWALTAREPSETKLGCEHFPPCPPPQALSRYLEEGTCIPVHRELTAHNWKTA